jgi:hypothetical protein
MRPGPARPTTGKIDARSLAAAAGQDAGETLEGLLTTLAVPNEFERDQLRRLGCVLLSSRLSTVNRVAVERLELGNVINLGFVVRFQLFHDRGSRPVN